MEEKKLIRVGSRKSELALIQTRHVISLLKKIHPDKEFEIVTMSTLGDKVLDIPLPKIGEKSLFTRELETALITGCVDFVVHSLKDLPTILPPGMAIGAVLTREDPRDALVLQKGNDKYLLETLPPQSVIGTSSLRRTAQLARKYPHLKVESIRGNLNTRLKKLDELDKYSGIILAAAGLIRMGWSSRITKVLEVDELMYAVGQGALAVECRESDEIIIELLRPLYDLQTALRIIAERSFLRTLEGGCSAPVAVASSLTRSKENKFDLLLKGAVWSLDGKDEIIEQDQCEVALKDFKRCEGCPYGGKIESNDIENLKSCVECPLSPTKNNAKRPKLDVPVDLLKNDPHEHCPVQMPIGVDFMGKCPYLESNSVLNLSKCPVSGAIEGSGDKHCPFIKDGKFQLEVNINQNNEPHTSKVKTYCGLVPYGDSSEVALEEAENLGRRLASNLLQKGGGEIMTKAQATIHSSIPKPTTTAS